VIEQFCDWLSRTALSVAFQNAAWFVPAVQTVHIISIAILLVSVYLIGFKLLGFMGSAAPLSATTARSMPWIWSSLLVLLLSGALLTITEPARELLNWVFRTKMILVLVLALLLVLVQRGVRRDPGYWADSRRGAARVLGGAMVVIGAGIITAGRWIAYV
jgi:magnesium-transporting ATPase (P-type)